MNASDARQFELTFRPGNAKFNTLAANIGYQYVNLVGNIVVKPRATGRYEKLKSEVIKKLANSHSTRDETPETAPVLEGLEETDRPVNIE